MTAPAPAPGSVELLVIRHGQSEWNALREHNIGDWDGQTWDEIEVDWPGAKAAWVAEEIDQPPGGESRHDFHARLWQALTHITRDRPGQQILVVAHGGVVRALERIGGAQPRPIAFLSGRWFTWTEGRLQAERQFQAGEQTGRDFEPTSQGN